MASTTIILVRHGAHGHLGRVLTGRMPGVPLAEAGRAQAERVASRLAGEAIAALYSSPMERARETAEPIARALGLEVETCEALNEIEFGDWTGLSFDGLDADPRWHAWNRGRADGCPPGGEPMAAVQERACREVETWRGRHPDAAVVAVSHADVVKAVVCRFLGLSLDRHDAFEIGPASLTTLVAWEGGGKVMRLNEAAA